MLSPSAGVFLWDDWCGVLLVEVEEEGDAVGFVVEGAAFIRCGAVGVVYGFV